MNPIKQSCLPKDYRIRQRQDYLRIQQAGKKIRSAHLLLSVVSLSAEALPRIGITITRKVNKRAVQRNRFKRVIREFFRLNRYRLVAPADIVVIGLQGATELDNKTIREEFERLLIRGGIVCPRAS